MLKYEIVEIELEVVKHAENECEELAVWAEAADNDTVTAHLNVCENCFIASTQRCSYILKM